MHDMTTARGLIAAVISLLSIRCGALVHLATVCTSFVFINSGTHTRSIAFPLGWRTDLSYVELGNILGSRSASLALLSWGLGGFPILEQPLRSVLTALPSWQSVIRYFDEAESKGWIGQRIKKSHIDMASFRAPTLKPTALFSTEAFQPLMDLSVPPKSKRPPVEAPVCHECHGFEESDKMYTVCFCKCVMVLEATYCHGRIGKPLFVAQVSRCQRCQEGARRRWS